MTSTAAPPPPKLTVILAAYNHEAYVAAMVDSILAQTFQDFELIAIDDGSRDRTPELLAGYAPRLRLIRQENAGVIAARMRGLAEARGEYVCIVDSDDLLHPERFAKQVAALDANPKAGLVYSDADVIDANGRHLGAFHDLYRPYDDQPDVELFCRYCFVPAITVMFRRGAFEATGPLWGPGAICDYVKWIEIASIAPILRLPERLGSWRRHATSVSFTANPEKSYLETIETLQELLRRRPDLAERVGGRAAARYARAEFMIGFFKACAGDVGGARTWFRKARATSRSEWAALGGGLLCTPPLSLLAPTIFRLAYSMIFRWR